MGDLFKKDIFKKDLFKSVESEKELRKLRTWAVKLPEETIEELERVFQSSGIRYKNDFIEKMLQEHKFALSLEESDAENDSLIHGEVSKNAASDLKEINRLTQNMRSIYLSQAEKLSGLQYEIEQLKKENAILKKNTSQSVINDYLLGQAKKEIGNQIFLGTSGIGKTYAMGLEMKKAIAQGKKVILIDLQGEYKNFTESLNGHHIELGKDRLNPFEFYTKKESEYVLTEKMVDILSFIELLLNRSFAARERKVLLSAIEQTYNEFGFTREDRPEGNSFPTLTHLEKHLRRQGEDGIALAEELEVYIIGILSDFNGERNVEVVESPIVRFDLHNLDRSLIGAGCFHSLEFIYMMIKNDLLNDALFVFDETWLLQNNQSIHLLRKILHFGKEAGMCFLISSQQTTEFYRYLEAITSYFDTTVYFRQSLHDLNYIKTHLGIEHHQLDLLKKAKKGECIVVSKEDFPFFMNYPKDQETALLLNPLSNFSIV